MAPSPVGIKITKGSRTWIVGNILGTGACATVCSLNSIDASSGNCNETEFAVKLAPLPKKKTKKGNSVEETNVKLLYYEQLVYNSQFRKLQGEFIPNIPKLSSSKSPPVYGVADGYRYFVMEKMDNTISAVVPLLLQSKSSSKSINFGPIAAALFTCIRACHEAKNIFRDVKSDNFMLTIDAAAATAKAKAGSTTLENELASRIRLIDLAIATQWTPMYYETDEADFNGTPLYASLNVHSGKKASFRDDLEAVGYVLAELIIQLNSGDPSKKLPWSHGKSDRDIGSIKKSLVEDKNSDFYAQLGNASRLFSEYLDIIRGYSFKEAPDYDELAKILSKITLPRTTATKSRRAATKKTAQAKKTAPTKRKTPSKVARRSTAKKTETEDDEDHYTGDPDQSFDDSVYADAHETVEDMEWEYIVDENEKPKEDSKPSARSDRALRRQRFNADKQHVGKVEEIIVIDDDGDDDDDDESSESNSGIGLKRRGVRLLVTKGPHKGDSYDLEAGANEIVLIGSNPTSKIGAVLSLKKDKTLNTTHVRLDLAITRKCTAVKVTARSNAKTLVNNNAVNSTKAFINDNIVIGGTTLSVQTL